MKHTIRNTALATALGLALAAPAGATGLKGRDFGAIRVGDGTTPGAAFTARIGSVLSGPGGLDKTDGGTLILTAENTYAGGTRVSGGVLQLGDGGLGHHPLGAADAVRLELQVGGARLGDGDVGGQGQSRGGGEQRVAHGDVSF